MLFKKADKLNMIIGEGSQITGDIEAHGTALLEGTLFGNFHGEKIILGEKAYVKGNLFGRAISIGGRIDGNLFGADTVDLRPTGHVTGDIHTKKLAIMEGAVFNGMSSVEEHESAIKDNKVVEFAAKS